MNPLKKIIFLIKKAPIIIVTGKGRSCASQAIFLVLKPYFKTRKVSDNIFPLPQNKNEILIIETELKKDLEKFQFLLKNSRLPILILTNVGEIPADKNFFAGERKDAFPMRKLAEVLPAHGFLVLNFDDETVREIKNETIAHSLTYGFQERADFQATDINVNFEGTNFKMNYEGNIVPFWLENLFGKEQIYTALIATSVGVIKDVNLIEISQTLRLYQSFPGKMRLIKGVKKSSVLDDSESATALSMIEALDVLGKIGKGRRKIAVLGDILGIGKYTIEAHETIGEKVAKVSNLLFTIGPRAKFIAEGAKNKGMAEENIFQFDKTKEAKIELQEEIKKDDLILVDGSKEMKMGEMVKEIKA
jgi:UDP-N-acetylmuramoyl-tripeptide--D-alanyl-D-alanine ligase